MHLQRSNMSDLYMSDDSDDDDASVPQLLDRNDPDYLRRLMMEDTDSDDESIDSFLSFKPATRRRSSIHYRPSPTTVIPSPTVYTVSAHQSRSTRGSLVDRGANGGIVGDDARVIHQHQRQVDVTGIDNHEMNALKIVDASGKITTQYGPAIVILKQYAYHGQGRTIHSALQLEHYQNKVDDRSMKAGGTQCIRTLEGYVIPLDIINGLPYMKMVPNTDDEWDTLPHIILTSGDDWNTTVLDNTLTDREDWYNTVKDIHDGLIDTPFDEYGEYRHRQPTTTPRIDRPEPAPEAFQDTILPPADTDDTDLRQVFLVASDLNNLPPTAEPEILIESPGERVVKPLKIDYQKWRPYLLHVPIEKVRQTFKNTTQHATNVVSGRIIRQTLKSPFPAHNVYRRNEPVATDTIYAGTPAIGTGGQCAAQLFIGRKSLVIDIYGMKSNAEFVNTLEDVIRKRGAMDKLISDSARVEISARVKDILRALCIDSWQSERNYQHQNFSEHRWHHFKRNINWIMNWRNVPPNIWLLCAKWVADVMNHTSEKSLGWRPPLQVMTGQTVDISILLCFMFWDVVYIPRCKGEHYNKQIGHEKSSEI